MTIYNMIIHINTLFGNDTNSTHNQRVTGSSPVRPTDKNPLTN